MDNIFELIATNYTAVEKLEEADFTPTTVEVHQKIVQHTGLCDLSLSCVFSYLNESGYVQMDIGDLHFVWLMKSDFSVLFPER